MLATTTTQATTATVAAAASRLWAWCREARAHYTARPTIPVHERAALRDSTPFGNILGGTLHGYWRFPFHIEAAKEGETLLWRALDQVATLADAEAFVDAACAHGTDAETWNWVLDWVARRFRDDPCDTRPVPAHPLSKCNPHNRKPMPNWPLVHLLASYPSVLHRDPHLALAAVRRVRETWNAFEAPFFNDAVLRSIELCPRAFEFDALLDSLAHMLSRPEATRRERAFVMRVLHMLDGGVLLRHEALVDGMARAVQWSKSKAMTERLERLIAYVHHPKHHNFAAEVCSALLCGV